MPIGYHILDFIVESPIHVKLSKKLLLYSIKFPKKALKKVAIKTLLFLIPLKLTKEHIRTGKMKIRIDILSLSVHKKTNNENRYKKIFFLFLK